MEPTVSIRKQEKVKTNELAVRESKITRKIKIKGIVINK